MSLHPDRLANAVQESAYDLHTLEYEIQWLRTSLTEEVKQALATRLADQLRSQAITLMKLADSLQGRTWDFALPSSPDEWR